MVSNGLTGTTLLPVRAMALTVEGVERAGSVCLCDATERRAAGRGAFPRRIHSSCPNAGGGC